MTFFAANCLAPTAMVTCQSQHKRDQIVADSTKLRYREHSGEADRDGRDGQNERVLERVEEVPGIADTVDDQNDGDQHQRQHNQESTCSQRARKHTQESGRGLAGKRKRTDVIDDRLEVTGLGRGRHQVLHAADVRARTCHVSSTADERSAGAIAHSATNNQAIRDQQAVQQRISQLNTDQFW